jgi:hypothetical protein
MDAVSVHHGGLCNNRGASDRRRRDVSLRNRLIKLPLIKLPLIKLNSLSTERFRSIPSDDVDLGTSGRSDDGGKDAFHEGCRYEPGLVGFGQELEREFSTEQSRTEIHDHHDAIAVVGSGYSLGHAHGVGAEAVIGATGSDLNGRRWTLHHL